MSERILSVLVEDKPGVLARVSSTISRRGFNIKSLSKVELKPAFFYICIICILIIFLIYCIFF